MKFILYIIIAFTPLFSWAKLKVITTTTTLASIVEEIGKDKVLVSSLTKHTQDPHFVEAKPSYMSKLRKADLLVAVGLDLEVGWLDLLQRGSKNPKILDKKRGFFSAGDHIDAIEKVYGKVDRSKGDVHAKGNPHFHWDPMQTLTVAKALSDHLSLIDPDNKEYYKNNYDLFLKKINSKILSWRQRITSSKVKNVLTYHKSFNYFLKRFSINSVGNIEPKPGVPPSAKHIIKIIKVMKNQNVRCIINESYFEVAAAKRIQSEAGAMIRVVPVEVVTNFVDLIDKLVTSIEECGSN